MAEDSTEEHRQILEQMRADFQQSILSLLRSSPKIQTQEMMQETMFRAMQRWADSMKPIAVKIVAVECDRAARTSKITMEVPQWFSWMLDDDKRHLEDAPLP